MKYDVVIIGAGLGGLTAGAKLAKEGRKVLVIEHHNRPGGCATTFKRGDFTMEVGLHEMDGPSPRDMKTRIFADLGVTENVTLLPVPEFYRFINDRYSLTVDHDPAKTTETLTHLFPGDADGIKTYFDRLLNPKKRPAGEQEKDISVGEYLDSIIKNDDLKLILLGNLGYFHDDPYSLSMTYYTLAQGSYYSGGASYIRGGSQKLSDHLTNFIRAKGGEVLLNHLVTDLSTEGNHINTVLCEPSGKQEVREFHADEIIANTSVLNLAGMVPGIKINALEEEFNGLRPGASLLTLYLGFKKNLREHGNRFYSTAVFDNSVKTQADIIRNCHDDFSRRNFIFVDYSQVDSALAPEGKSVGAICCIDYLSEWEGLEKKDYLARKEYVAKTFLARLEKIIPGVSEITEYYNVGTPSTVMRYTLNPEGAVYGFAQTPGRRIADPLRSFDNLHIASAWGKTGGGFSGAICGGYLCALGILRKRPAGR